MIHVRRRGQLILLWTITIGLIVLGFLVAADIWISKREEAFLDSLRQRMVMDSGTELLKSMTKVLAGKKGN